MFDLLEGILHELKDIPGLAFLRSLHGQLMHKRRIAAKSMKDAQTRTENITGLTGRLSRVAARNKVEKRRKE